MEPFSAGRTRTARLLLASKLSSYLRTVPGNSCSLLGFHLAGMLTLKPSPVTGTKPESFLGAAKMFAERGRCVNSKMRTERTTKKQMSQKRVNPEMEEVKCRRERSQLQEKRIKMQQQKARITVRGKGSKRSTNR